MHTNNSTNQSTYTYDAFTTKLDIIQGSIYIPIFCAGLANNILTVLIILLNRDMRTVTNCYLLNLAISDTLPLIVSLPFEISFLPMKIPWGHVGCKLRALLAETSTNTSILTISAFTIERYLAVCRPLRSSSLSTNRRATRIQLVIWLVAILSSTPYLHFTTYVDNQCRLDENLRFYATICFDLSATFFFLLPAFILCLLYALMAQRLYNIGLLQEKVQWSKKPGMNSMLYPMNMQPIERDQHRSNRRHLSTPTLILSRSSVYRNGNLPYPGLTLHIQSMKKSAFKMLFAVVIAFIICYAPFHVQRLITSRLNVTHLSLLQQRAITIFYFISGIFYYIGSTVNPIFYHLFSRKYRLTCIKTMKRLIHCKKQQQQQQQHQMHRHRVGSNAEKKNTNEKDPIQVEQHQQNQIRATKANETIFRSPNRMRINIDAIKMNRHVLRASIPAYTKGSARMYQ